MNEKTMKSRCKVNTLFGYCKESDGRKYYISFPAPCNKGLGLLCGGKIETCPNYLTFTQFNKVNVDYQDLFKLGTPATYIKDISNLKINYWGEK